MSYVMQLCTRLKSCLCVCVCTAAWCKIILCRSLVSAESQRKGNNWSFCQCVAQKKRAQKEFKHKNQKRSIFSPFGILSAINQKHPCIPPCFWDEDEEWMNKWMKKWLDNEGVLVCDETQSMCKSTWIQGWNLYWLTDLLQEQRECHTARVTNVGYIYTAKS